eukprot:c9709_g1_i3.p1 GENE.c9709_g1_i3~~c9709_g1_i3.p1  ORF type:complete len:264 (+),score=43.22 c9709_g1_i3:1-792(+)
MGSKVSLGMKKSGRSKRKSSKGGDKSSEAKSSQKKAEAELTTPADARLMKHLLEVMDAKSHEPRVINQLLEFAQKYITDVLSDATQYAGHANRDHITVEDARLAVDARLNDTFTHPLPREALTTLAKKKNAVALPLVPSTLGIHLPPEKFRLSKPNYQVVPRPPAVPVPQQRQEQPAATSSSFEGGESGEAGEGEQAAKRQRVGVSKPPLMTVSLSSNITAAGYLSTAPLSQPLGGMDSGDTSLMSSAQQQQPMSPSSSDDDL